MIYSDVTIVIFRNISICLLMADFDYLVVDGDMRI